MCCCAVAQHTVPEPTRAQEEKLSTSPTVVLVHGAFADAPARARELAQEIASLAPMSVANAKRALYLGADSNLQAAFEVENMNWTEVMQSDDAQVALSAFLAVDPSSRRDWFESESTKTYPAYSGQRDFRCHS